MQMHNFPPSPQLRSQPIRGLLPISLLGEQRIHSLNSLPKTVTRQHHGCNINSGPTAPKSSTVTTRLPSRHLSRIPHVINMNYICLLLLLLSSVFTSRMSSAFQWQRNHLSATATAHTPASSTETQARLITPVIKHVGGR